MFQSQFGLSVRLSNVDPVDRSDNHISLGSLIIGLRACRRVSHISLGSPATANSPITLSIFDHLRLCDAHAEAKADPPNTTDETIAHRLADIVAQQKKGFFSLYLIFFSFSNLIDADSE